MNNVPYPIKLSFAHVGVYACVCFIHVHSATILTNIFRVCFSIIRAVFYVVYFLYFFLNCVRWCKHSKLKLITERTLLFFCLYQPFVLDNISQDLWQDLCENIYVKRPPLLLFMAHMEWFIVHTFKLFAYNACIKFSLLFIIPPPMKTNKLINFRLYHFNLIILYTTSMLHKIFKTLETTWYIQRKKFINITSIMEK